jgi:primosomal protein N' (replication factor Y) (superfamily II helicase)
VSRETKFVDVIVPLAVPNLYTYRVPLELNDAVEVGQRVVVQFGKNKLYTAVVALVHDKAPLQYTAKYLHAVLDEQPIVNNIQISFWQWMADYYCCTIGEVMLAALPAALKLSSETRVLLNPDFTDKSQLSDEEYLIVDALEIQQVLSLQDISDILQKQTVYPHIKSLLQQKAVVLEEELKEKFKPKIKAFVFLNERYKNNTEEAFNLLNRAPKQADILLIFLQMVKDNAHGRVDKLKLQEASNSNASNITALVEKNIFELEEIEVGRFVFDPSKASSSPKLSEEQTRASEEIKQHFIDKQTVLLHGVTGSGKTEIYVHLMAEYIAKGGKCLYLVPEIALTTQLVGRLKSFFGDRVGVYHSKFNDNERVEIWQNTINENRYDVVIGARSALFLPFEKLDLIIVDEEHESSFKQYEPAPRYHARDAALMLAKMHECKVLLGSATPSIESYWNAKENHFGLVELFTRYSGVMLPEIFCADIQEEQKRKKMHSHFSSFLIEHIKQALENKEQIILFQNRRGYAPLWSCEDCGWVPQCHQCDVSLTYHKHSHLLSCHYCGQSEKPPITCKACGSSKLKMVGFGTEKIEEELAIFFPAVKIARMDLDTTRTKHAHANIIEQFENRDIDILVGTQMVTKGLDFDNVGLVGVLNADLMLSFPDFRAFERSYQLMAQVSGRAGRQQKRGKVVIQTYNPNHWVIQKVMYNDYAGLYQQEILERRNFKYPPFYRLISLTFKHKDRSVTDKAAQWFTQQLIEKLGKPRVLGPETPYVSRIRNYYLKTALIKFERNASAKAVKQILNEQTTLLSQHKEFKSVRVVVDVDSI